MALARLTERTILKVGGPEARHFLANIVTCDLPPDEGGLAYGALLTPQGKIIADFFIHRLGEGFALDIAAAAAPDLLKRLTLYRLRAKVDIAEAGEALAVFAGWDGAAPEGAHADPRLEALGWRMVAAPDALSPDTDAVAYHARRVLLGVPEGGTDFLYNDAFPHDAAMDCLHGVAFRKGCYIGQEVVSRMQHRGTARRRMVLLTASNGGALPETGADVLAGEKVVGRLGSSADGKAIALVRIDRLGEAIAAGQEISAGGTPVAAALPDWACYTWPEATAGGQG
ncbi:folate-binding protein YgfZ [Afifella sp. IM 167]|uniref:CAF17-like 4Fe-4S cluster assembly/insertion protein YgfZ n=1 Tax=Afifella sp. IM 167 TaxID=2033586 RepID=UPI001CCD7961|nr:folate-binding protein [Afifella sp. IM 167]MBZ8133407.1 folate-binding protein YgfZ [Afifella sp. IM 167]